MQDSLPIIPFHRPATGVAHIPGSKSITNRALIMAALSDHQLVLENALFSRDTRIMYRALRGLGFAVETNEAAATITITGYGGKIPVAKHHGIFVGNAGTAARFLTAFIALHPEGNYRLDGDPAMRERPMSGLLDALTSAGAASVEYSDAQGHFPFAMRTHGLCGGTIPVDASASSQILSALMMIAPFAGAPITLKPEQPVRPAYIAITREMMERCGARIEETGDGTITIHPLAAYAFPGGTYAIEPDASAASYFFALPVATGGTITVPIGSASMQGDIRFLEPLLRTGIAARRSEAETRTANDRNNAGPADRPGLNGVACDFEHFSDTFLTLAALAPLLDSETRITGIAHTRKQETDRVAGMATELAKIVGQDGIHEEHSAITIRPDYAAMRDRVIRRVADKGPVIIDTYEDHRFAMSFGILGCNDLLGNGRPWLAIRNPDCAGKTFPHFFQELARLRNLKPS